MVATFELECKYGIFDFESCNKNAQSFPNSEFPVSPLPHVAPQPLWGGSGMSDTSLIFALDPCTQTASSVDSNMLSISESGAASDNPCMQTASLVDSDMLSISKSWAASEPCMQTASSVVLLQSFRLALTTLHCSELCFGTLLLYDPGVLHRLCWYPQACKRCRSQLWCNCKMIRHCLKNTQ